MSSFELVFQMTKKSEEDAILHQFAEMKVTAEEKASVFHQQEEAIDVTEKKLVNVVLCKIFTKKKITPEVFKSMMPKIWNQEHTIIDYRGFNLFLFKFKNARIKSHIVESGPWFYDRTMLLLADPKGDCSGDEMEFRYVSFWVHFHKLPLACFSRSAAMEIRSLVGKVEQVDLEDVSDENWGSSLRIKIQVDITSPLKRGVFLKSVRAGNEKWITMTYEKLPDFCYGCGGLGHIIKECEEDTGSDTEDIPYGPWMGEPTKLVSKGPFGA